MQFPESWLREYCNPDLTTKELADTLTMAGLEVEEVWPAAPAFTGVVIGEIKQVEPHPDADRLRVCQVDVGGADLLKIVCGAPNARVGIRVPVAVVGAELPPAKDSESKQPFKITVGKLRGVESYGMLCSEVELGISEEGAGLYELAPDAPLGKNIRAYLDLDSSIFLVKLTPDLAHCLSVYGIARELSALTGAPLKKLEFPEQKVNMTEVLPIDVQAPDLCGRFSGRLMRGLNTEAKTPEWMVRKLERCGQRSISALVDISNYVLYELGRPSHIFDADKIQGSLQIRWGVKGEKLTLLNGSTVEVDEEVGVVADDRMVESLAGIMGGEDTSVTATTNHVFIEAAFWWPQAIAGRTRRYNFVTDAAHRFERGVDPASTVKHVEYITQLILSICGTADTQCGPMSDVQPNMPQKAPVTLRIARAQKIIGIPVTQEQCIEVFKRLDIPFTVGEGALTITPPSWRFDLQYEVDLIEEVARLIGYERLPVSTPIGPISSFVTSEQERTPMELRRKLASLGYLETISFSFVPRQWESDLLSNADPIQVLNPIASNLEVMRSSLLPSLLQVLKQNLDRRADRVQIFELARVFKKDSKVQDSNTTLKGVDQPRMVAGLIYGAQNPLQWGKQRQGVDFYDIKGDVEALLSPHKLTFVPAEHPLFHPGRCAHVMLDKKTVGIIGELHPKWKQEYDLPHTPVLFELAFDAIKHTPLASYKAISRFPVVHRDVAFILPNEATYAEIIKTMEQAVAEYGILKKITLFDIYKPKEGSKSEMPAGHKSMAFRLDLADDTATLTDERIHEVTHKMVKELEKQHKAKLRS